MNTPKESKEILFEINRIQKVIDDFIEETSAILDKDNKVMLLDLVKEPNARLKASALKRIFNF